jgi:hypothetical protein
MRKRGVRTAEGCGIGEPFEAGARVIKSPLQNPPPTPPHPAVCMNLDHCGFIARHLFTVNLCESTFPAVSQLVSVYTVAAFPATLQ